LLLMKQKDYDGAEKLMLEVLENQKKKLGEKHPAIATLLENLGNVYYSSGHPDKTLELLDQTAALRREVFGPTDPAVGRTLFTRGLGRWGMGRSEAAGTSVREGLALVRPGLGDHPDVAQMYEEHAGILTELKDDAGAERALRETLRIRRKVFGDASADTASSK